MKNESKKFLFLSGERPRNFHGTLRLPSSKSYLHRALFIASLASGTSMIHNCGRKLSEDVKGTLRAISGLWCALQVLKQKKWHNNCCLFWPVKIQVKGDLCGRLGDNRTFFNCNSRTGLLCQQTWKKIEDLWRQIVFSQADAPPSGRTFCGGSEMSLRKRRGKGNWGTSSCDRSGKNTCSIQGDH